MTEVKGKRSGNYIYQGQNLAANEALSQSHFLFSDVTEGKIIPASLLLLEYAIDQWSQTFRFYFRLWLREWKNKITLFIAGTAGSEDAYYVLTGNCTEYIVIYDIFY